MCTVMAHNHFVDTQNRNTQPLCKNNTHNHSEDSFKVYHHMEQDIITVYAHNTPEWVHDIST